MIMGKIISRKKYEYYEYVTAVLISVGMAFFMLGSVADRKGNITVSPNTMCFK
jgi:adenosine 3'-phospho 5'-phosphosulfate transporter B2